MAGRSFGRKQTYGLTVTVSSEEWCAPRIVTVPVLLLVGILRVHFLYLNPKICT